LAFAAVVVGSVGVVGGVAQAVSARRTVAA
jgi:hypothetical protein